MRHRAQSAALCASLVSVVGGASDAEYSITYSCSRSRFANAGNCRIHRAATSSVPTPPSTTIDSPNTATLKKTPQRELGRFAYGTPCGVPYFNEREERGSPIDLAGWVGGEAVGHYRHTDGEGWKPFEFSTARFDGQVQSVEFRVTSARAWAREFCFQADVR